jgi:hypothetical protein
LAIDLLNKNGVTEETLYRSKRRLKVAAIVNFICIVLLIGTIPFINGDIWPAYALLLTVYGMVVVTLTFIFAAHYDLSRCIYKKRGRPVARWVTCFIILIASFIIYVVAYEELKLYYNNMLNAISFFILMSLLFLFQSFVFVLAYIYSAVRLGTPTPDIVAFGLRREQFRESDGFRRYVGSNWYRKTTHLLLLLSLAIMEVNWLILLFKIKTHPPPFNMAGAWPYDWMPDFYLIGLVSFLLLISGMFLSELRKPPSKRFSYSLFAAPILISLAFFFLIFTVGAMCECSDAGIIGPTYQLASFFFVVDIAVMTFFAAAATKDWDNRARRSVTIPRDRFQDLNDDIKKWMAVNGFKAEHARGTAKWSRSIWMIKFVIELTFLSIPDGYEVMCEFYFKGTFYEYKVKRYAYYQGLAIMAGWKVMEQFTGFLEAISKR